MWEVITPGSAAFACKHARPHLVAATHASFRCVSSIPILHVRCLRYSLQDEQHIKGPSRLLLYVYVMRWKSACPRACACVAAALRFLTHEVRLARTREISWHARGLFDTRAPTLRRRVPEECPAEISNLIRDCLSAEPEARPSSTEAFLILQQQAALAGSTPRGSADVSSHARYALLSSRARAM